jgi:hypothetical protein
LSRSTVTVLKVTSIFYDNSNKVVIYSRFLVNPKAKTVVTVRWFCFCAFFIVCFNKLLNFKIPS